MLILIVSGKILKKSIMSNKIKLCDVFAIYFHFLCRFFWPFFFLISRKRKWASFSITVSWDCLWFEISEYAKMLEFDDIFQKFRQTVRAPKKSFGTSCQIQKCGFWPFAMFKNGSRVVTIFSSFLESCIFSQHCFWCSE